MRRGSPSREPADGPEGPTSARAAARAGLVLRPSAQGAHIKRQNGQAGDAEQNLGSPLFPRDFDHFRSLLGSPLPPLNSPPLFQPSPRRSTLPSPARPANQRANGCQGTGVDGFDQFFSQSPALSRMLFSPTAMTTNNIFDTPTHKGMPMPGNLFTPTPRKANPCEHVFALFREAGRQPGQYQQQPSNQHSQPPSGDAPTIKQEPPDSGAGGGSGGDAEQSGAVAKGTTSCSDPLEEAAAGGMPRSTFQLPDGPGSPGLGLGLGLGFSGSLGGLLGGNLFPGPGCDADAGGGGGLHGGLAEGGYKLSAKDILMGPDDEAAPGSGAGGRQGPPQRNRVLDFCNTPRTAAAAAAAAAPTAADGSGGADEAGGDRQQAALGGGGAGPREFSRMVALPPLPALPVLPALPGSGQGRSSQASIEAQQPLFPGYYPRHPHNEGAVPPGGHQTSGGSHTRAGASGLEVDAGPFPEAAAAPAAGGSGGTGGSCFMHGMVPNMLPPSDLNRVTAAATVLAEEERAAAGGGGGCGKLQGVGMGMPPGMPPPPSTGVQQAGMPLLSDVRQGAGAGVVPVSGLPTFSEQLVAGVQHCRASSSSVGGGGGMAGGPRMAGVQLQHHQQQQQQLAMVKGESFGAAGPDAGAGAGLDRQGLPPRSNGGGGLGSGGGAASTPSTLQRPHRTRTAPNLYEGAGSTRRPASLELDGTSGDPSWDPPLSQRTSGNGSGSNRPRRASETNNAKSCRCKKSQCLKLYCDCFAAGQYCGACSCVSCHNRPEYADRVQQRREDIAARDPTAFTRKIKDAKHKRGCNCRRSHCLKKYCECYQGGVKCGMQCTCLECENMDVPAPAEAGGGRGKRGGGTSKAGGRGGGGGNNRGGSRRNSGSGALDDWAPSPSLPTTSGCSDGPSPAPSFGTMPHLSLMAPPTLQGQLHHHQQQQQQLQPPPQHLALASCVGVGGSLSSCILGAAKGTPPASSRNPSSQQQLLAATGATQLLEGTGARRRSSLGAGGNVPAAAAGLAPQLQRCGSQAQLSLMEVDACPAVQQVPFGAAEQCGGLAETEQQQQQQGVQGLLSSAALGAQRQPQQQAGWQAKLGTTEEGDKGGGQQQSSSESEEDGQGRRKKSRRIQEDVKAEPDRGMAAMGPTASGGGEQGVVSASEERQDDNALHSANASNETHNASHQQPRATNTCHDPAATVTTADARGSGPAASAAGAAAPAAAAAAAAAAVAPPSHMLSDTRALQEPHSVLHDSRLTPRALGISLDVMSPPPLSMIMGSLMPSDSSDDDDEDDGDDQLGVNKMTRRAARERAARCGASGGPGMGPGRAGGSMAVQQPLGGRHQRGDVHLVDAGLELGMTSDLHMVDAMIAAIAGEAAGPHGGGAAAGDDVGLGPNAGGGGGGGGDGVLLCGELLGGSLLDDPGHDFFMPGSEPNSIGGGMHHLLLSSELQPSDLAHGPGARGLRSFVPGPGASAGPTCGQWLQQSQPPSGLRRPSRFGPSSRFGSGGGSGCTELLPYDVTQHSWAASAAGGGNGGGCGFLEHGAPSSVTGGGVAASVHTLVSPVRTSVGPPSSRRKASEMAEEGAEMGLMPLHAPRDGSADDHRENWALHASSSPSKQQQRFQGHLQPPHPLHPMQLLSGCPNDLSLYDTSRNQQQQQQQGGGGGGGGGGGRAEAKGSGAGGARGGGRGGRGAAGRARNAAEKEMLKASALQYITQRLGGGGGAAAGGGVGSLGGVTMKPQPMDIDSNGTGPLAGQVPIQAQGFGAPHPGAGLSLATPVPCAAGLAFPPPPPPPQHSQQQHVAGTAQSTRGAGNHRTVGGLSAEGGGGGAAVAVGSGSGGNTRAPTAKPVGGDAARVVGARGPVIGVAGSGGGGGGTPAGLQPVRMGAMTKLGSGSTVFFSPNSNGGPRAM